MEKDKATKVSIEITLEKLCNQIFQAHHKNYLWLRKYGPNAFENSGKLLCIMDGVEQTLDGRIFILKTLAYFEIQDQPVFYRWCATLKKVLDAYDEHFKTTPGQKVKSEEGVLAFRQVELTRKEFVEKILIAHRNKVASGRIR